MARNTGADDLLDGSEPDDDWKDVADDIVDSEFDGLTDGDVDGEGAGDEDEDGVADASLATGGESLDEDEGEEPDKGVDRGDGRDAAGKFAKDKADREAAGKPADKGAAKDGKPGETPADKVVDKATDKAADKPAAEEKPAAEAPKWEPLQVRSGKVVVPIEEAQVTKANGYTIFSVKDEQAPRFMDRLNRAHLFEQNRVAIEQRVQALAAGIKELETERAAPQAQTDAEIEAAIVLATVMPHLEEILTPEQFENMKLRVKLAQKDHRDSFTTKRKEYFDGVAKKQEDEAAPQQDIATQEKGIVDTLFGVFREHQAELTGLTEKELRQVHEDLTKIGRAVYWKEGGEWYHNTQLVFDHLKRQKDAMSSGGSSDAPPAKGNTAAGTSDAGTGGSADAKPDGKGTSDKPAKGDQFNRGVDSAAKPRSNSLKNGRERQRPRDERNTREPANASSRREKPAEMVAEDQYRKTTRAYLNSDSLDFEEDDES